VTKNLAHTLRRLLWALPFFGIVSACQPAAQPGLPTSPAPARPRATVTATSNLRPSVPDASLEGIGLQVWHPWMGVEASLLETQVAEFNQQNEWGITVRATRFTGFSEVFSSLGEALPGGEAANIAISLPEHAIAWDTDGYVVDLTTYVDDPAYGLARDETTDFSDVFWNQDVMAGRRLGMPAQRSARFVIYNESWAKELGFENAPLNEMEFREQACAANASLRSDDDPANDGKGGWLVDAHPMTFLSWMMSFGGGVLEGDGYRFLGPRNLEALAFVKQLYDDGCAWLPQAQGELPSQFAAREGLFATAGLEELSAVGRGMAEAQNSDAWTALTFPGPVQPGLVAYGSSFVIFKSTPEAQLASWLFVRWLLSPDNQIRWTEATGLFPLRGTITADLSDYARTHPQWEAAIGYVADAQIQPQLASWRQVRVMVGDGFDAMFRTNTPAGRVAEILAIMDRTADDLEH
jgi:multiple sugar transport system substrate-binding protein